MTTPDRLAQAGALLESHIQSATPASDNRLDVVLDPAELIAAVTTLHTARWGYLSTITGLDHGDRMEVLYHFCEGGAILTLRVGLTRDYLRVPSLCGIIPSAILQERELHEMFGIEVSDIPDDSRLFLPDDWQDGVYPLRRDAELTIEGGG